MEESSTNNESQPGGNNEVDDEVFTKSPKSKINPFTLFNNTLKNPKKGMF